MLFETLITKSYTYYVWPSAILAAGKTKSKGKQIKNKNSRDTKETKSEIQILTIDKALILFKNCWYLRKLKLQNGNISSPFFKLSRSNLDQILFYHQ